VHQHTGWLLIFVINQQDSCCPKNRKCAGCKARHRLKKYKKAINWPTAAIQKWWWHEKMLCIATEAIPKATHGGINKGWLLILFFVAGQQSQKNCKKAAGLPNISLSIARKKPGPTQHCQHQKRLRAASTQVDCLFCFLQGSNCKKCCQKGSWNAQENISE